MLGVPVQAQEMIMVCTIAPKTGPFAGSASVTQWPNVEFWVKQVNAIGGLQIGDSKMMIEVVEYDDKTNPFEHIKLAQRLAEHNKVDFIVAPNGTGFNQVQNRWTSRDRGIPINSVSSGPVETPILGDFLKTLDARA